MRIGIYKVKAVLWLHILRLWRYKFSFINNVFSIMLWITIFVLGALMFIPKEQMSYVAPITFWGIVMWNIMSNSVWFIGGWSWFFISQGFVEEHFCAAEHFHIKATPRTVFKCLPNGSSTF